MPTTPLILGACALVATFCLGMGWRELPLHPQGAPTSALAWLFTGLFGWTAAVAGLFIALWRQGQARQRANEQRERRAERLLAEAQSTLDALPDLSFDLDAQGRLLALRTPHSPVPWLPSSMQQLGVCIWEHVPQEAVSAYQAALQEARDDGWAEGHRHRLITPTGIRSFEIAVAFVRGPTPESDRFLVVPRDITLAVQAQTRLELLTQLFEQSREAFVVTDSNERIIMINRAFSEITGYTESDVLGKVSRVAGPQRMDRSQHAHIWHELQTRNHWEGETWNFRKDGTRYPQWVSVHCLRDREGQISHFVGVFRDISQSHQTQAHIERLAHYDSLTGLPNRQLMAERVNKALLQAQANATPMALLCLDLDHFKNINDSLGHRIGDLILQAVAHRLPQLLRPQDLLARQGGDEFLILLADTDADSALERTHALIRLLSPVYEIERHELAVTPSIGLAMYPDDGDHFENLAQRAEAAMYRAKQDGRHRCCAFTSDIQARAVRTLRLENALRRALEREQFHLVYQAQIDLRSGQVTGVEALLRWQHPDVGAISPAEFIPIAEESGLILPIGEWVIGTATAQLKHWIDDGMPPIVLGVNLSAVQFQQNRLSERIAGLLQQAGLPAELLELELTEGVAVREPQSALNTMEELHRIGIRLSIDDFGTGYSSLNYLKRFPISRLKIDQSFVRDIEGDHENRAIVSAIIRMSNELGLQTIAEGVETQAQRDWLQLKGCDQAQGYLFSKPLPARDFRAFMARPATLD